jgi:hypothetical protein
LEGAAPSALTGLKDTKNTILPNDFIFLKKPFSNPSRIALAAGLNYGN